jgi:DNA-directed RNA polymerase specialized sigma24 family protein
MAEVEYEAQRERLFAMAREGSPEAFAGWAAFVELPLRRSLRRFAMWVDAEVVVQETLLRMWIFATKPDRPLEGSGASLRFALKVARNVALEETRKNHPGRRVDVEDLDEDPSAAIDPCPPSDPALRRAIEECIERLPGQPRQSILARLEGDGAISDRDLAAGLRMKLNTFLQNIVRARKLLAACLEGRGVQLEGRTP